ncbi:MAG: hypothetical protein QM756_20355 [Polyangiaceae bacterium]
MSRRPTVTTTRWSLKGVVTGPMSDTIAASLAAGYNKRDGYQP